MGAKDYEQFHPLTRAQWRDWLQENHASAPGVWLVTYKKSTGKPRPEYEEIVEEALCFGWIDGQGKGMDEERTMLLITPRKPRSGWARTNKERVSRLTAAGLMAPTGLAVVEAAKASGSWEALDAIEDMVTPADLAEALARDSQAAGYFEKFPPSVKKAIYYQVQSAKRPETRSKRVAEIVRMARENRRFGQWRDKT